MSRSAPTIPIASAGGAPTLSITDQDWSRIEKAYGHSLSAEVRQHIIEATTTFVSWEVFERTVDKRSPAKERIESVKQAARILRQKLSADHIKSKKTDDEIGADVLDQRGQDAHTYANYLIAKHFDDPLLASGDRLRHLHQVISSLDVACHLALVEMGDAAGFHEGECWDQWLRRLTAILKAQGLPIAASKGTTKLKNNRPPSPFVRLVEALQGRVPAGRRHTQSSEALAGAIHRARSGSARTE